ncbi:hypothetical protein BJF84_17910 [Rhodococcus sp. CUA-806]|nr:hypothetical protein BJF84_17910 [Rhodococcus sp. CUA-806]
MHIAPERQRFDIGATTVGPLVDVVMMLLVEDSVVSGGGSPRQHRIQALTGHRGTFAELLR